MIALSDLKMFYVPGILGRFSTAAGLRAKVIYETNVLENRSHNQIGRAGMTPSSVERTQTRLTLIELLCTIAIILVLAGLVLGPASHVLRRVRADKWGEDSSAHLQATVEQLRKHFQGKHGFAPVTLERIETDRLLGSSELEFLKDRRVTFIPFADSDPDDKVVIRVEVERGYLTEAGVRVETKGEITRLPE
jgi:hypothetical protein